MYEDEYKIGVAMLTGKGGQSAQRIERICENKQALYVKKLSELMVNTL